MKNFKIIICFLVLIKTHYLFCSSNADSSYTLLAAGVLPIIYNEDHSKITALLGIQVGSQQEADYFGGFTKNQYAQDPLTDAASEWHEESLLEKTLGWDIDKTKEYIQTNLKGYVILATQQLKSNNYGVMYIVNITPDIRDTIFKNFASARKEIEKMPKTDDVDDHLEVATLIEVNWNDLLDWSLKPKERKYHKKPIPISKADNPGFLLDENNIVVRIDALGNMLEGVADHEKQYVFQKGSKNLPIGVFIIGRRRDNLLKQSKGFELYKVQEATQIGLNTRVRDNLDLNHKKVKKAAAFGRINAGKKVPDNKAVKKSPEITQKKQTKVINETLPPVVPDRLLTTRALFNVMNLTEDLPQDAVSLPSSKKEELSNQPEPAFDRWAAIKKSFTKAVEKTIQIFQYILDGIGAFFKGA